MIDQNAVIRARCARQAIQVVRSFDRDPQSNVDSVYRLAVFIWAVVTNNNTVSEEDGKAMDTACAYALAAETIIGESLKPPLHYSGPAQQ